MSSLSADEASDHITLISMPVLISRASRELESDPGLRREVLLNLVRSLQEDRLGGGPPPGKSS